MSLQGGEGEELASKLYIVEPKVVTKVVKTPSGTYQWLFFGDSNCSLLDHVMSELEMRFSGDNLTAYCRFHTISHIMFTTPNTCN